MTVNLVCVGIDQLNRDISNKNFDDLRYAATDAVAIKKMLVEKCHITETELLADTTESDICPTRSNILLTLSKYSDFPYSSRPLIFFFAGHGVSIKDHFHICPSDYIDSIGSYTGLSLTTLLDVLSPRHSWSLIIFDCCRCEIAKDIIRFPDTKYTITDQISIIFACSKGQISIETEHNNSLFGGVFAHFFSNSISNSKRDYISIEEAFQNARNKTSFTSLTKYNEEQTPFVLGADLSLIFLENKET